MFRNLERKMIRAISIVLAVLLIAALIPVGTFISGAMGETYTVTLKTESEGTIELDDVTITLTNKADETDTTFATTDKGIASFGELIVGNTYSVSVDGLKGYTLETQEFVASDSNSSDVTIKEMEKITVSGVVKDNEDNAYEGATVEFSGYTEGTTTTDASGNYSFEVYKSQDYNVKAVPKSSDSAKYAETAEESIDASSNSTLDFKFELKEYSVSVSGANDDNGTIVAEPSTVKYGGSSTITVTPNKDNGYELTSVKDNDEEKLNTSTSEQFSFDIGNIQNNHDVEAVLALRKYTVSVTCGEGGSATIDGNASSLVEYGKSADIIIAPKKGYDVNSVKYDNNILEVKEVEDSNTNYYATVSDVKSDIAVDISFSASLEGNGDEYTFNSEIARSEGTTYYYGKDENDNPEKAVFTAVSGYKGIELRFSDGGSKGSRSQNTVEVDKTKTVKDIVVYGSNDNKSKTISNVNINLVMDTNAPSATANADPASWTNDSVTIKGTATDADDSESESLSDYYLTGSFNSWGESARMTDEGESIVSYNISLSAGTHEFKIKNGNTWYTNTGEPIIDTTETTSQGLGWEMKPLDGVNNNCKLQASGGYYRFIFNTSTKFLIILMLDLAPTESVSNASGIYEVKLMDGDTQVDTTNVSDDGSYSFEVSGEQQKTYKVVAVDKSGNESEPVDVDVKIDKTAPVVTAFEFDTLETSDDSGNYSNKNIDVKVTANDKESTVESGVKAIQLYKDGEKYGDSADVNSENCATITLKAEDFAEPAKISAKAIDNAGNESEMKKPSETSEDIESDEFIISTKEATVGITDSKLVESSTCYDNVTPHWYSDDAKFNVTVSTPDKNVPIKKITVKLGNKEITTDIDGKSFPVGGEKSEFSVSTAQDNSEKDNGENKITVSATLKNSVEIKESASLNIDTENPTVSGFDFNIQSSENNRSYGNFYNQNIEIKVTATDDANGIPSAGIKDIILYGKEKGKDSEFTDLEYDKTWDDAHKTATFKVPAEDIVGEDMFFNKDICARAVDNVSNKTDGTATDGYIFPTTVNSNIKDTNLMIETIRPEITISRDTAAYSSDGKDWYASDVEFTVDVSDNNSGIRFIGVSINDDDSNDDYYNMTPGFTEDSSSNFSSEKVTKTTFTVYTSDADIDENGCYVITVTVIDNAGNVKKSKDTIYKDIYAPKVTEFKFESTGYNKDKKLGKKNNTAAPVITTNYGFYFREKTTVTVSAVDKLNDVPSSGLYGIHVYLKDVDGTYYYVNDEGGIVTKTDYSPSKDIDHFIPVQQKEISFEVNKSFKGRIFARAIDNVGNYPTNSEETLNSSGEYDGSGFVEPDRSVVESRNKHKGENHITFNNIDKTDYSERKTLLKNGDYYNQKGDKSIFESGDYQAYKYNDVPLYQKKDGVKFVLTVEDTYSGIRDVQWGLITPAYNNGDINSKGIDGISIDNNDDGKIKKNTVLRDNWKVIGTDGNLITKLTKTVIIKENCNDMVIWVRMTDRAGNQSYDYYVFGNDFSKPEITVKYNNANTPKDFYNISDNKVTVDVTVKERNFNGNKSKDNQNGFIDFDIKNVDSDYDSLPKWPEKYSEWTKHEDSSNPDDWTYTYSIEFNKDGKYSFALNCEDLASNTSEYEEKGFVLDLTAPEIAVNYDENTPSNDKYFNKTRTATIQVTEHNFDENSVSILVNRTEEPLNFSPDDGNEHQATRVFSEDGDYTFSVSATDLAGNSIEDSDVDYGNSFPKREFTIDKTGPTVKINASEHNEFKNGLVLKDGETVNIDINDTNPGDYSIKLTRSRVLVSGESDNNEKASIDDVQEKVVSGEIESESNVDVTSEFLDVSPTGTGNVKATISIPKRTDDVKNDGVYTLTVKAVDLATNDYTDVLEEKTTDFSVNRFGSVYTFGDDLYKLITETEGYTQKITSNQLKIYEYNPDTVKTNKVEVISNSSSRTLTENTDYTFVLEDGQKEAEWSKYVYSLKPENFKKDGAYTVRISSTDEADNSSQTINYDVCKVNFFVDSTAPEISSVTYSSDVSRIALTDGGSANTDKLDINFTVEDLIRLDRVEVYVDDMDKPLKTYKYGKPDKKTELIFDDIHNFEGGKFTLESSGDAHEIKIIAFDKAGNFISTDSDKFNPGYTYFKEITVTTNFLVIWAKSPLFWIIMGVSVAAVGGATALIIVKRKKKVKAQ